MNNYKWLLDLLSTERSTFPILETGICRGTKLIDWYSRSKESCVSRNSTSIMNRTKLLLNQFLWKNAHLEDSDKVVCYLYHHKGLKLLNSKEVRELAENYLHGLQVSSIHLAVPTMHETTAYYEVSSWAQKKEIRNEIKFIGGKAKAELVEDMLLIDKALEIVQFVMDVFKNKTGKLIKSIKLHLIVNVRGNIQVVNIFDLQFFSMKQHFTERRNLRTNFISQEESESSIDKDNSRIFSFLNRSNRDKTPCPRRIPVYKKPEPITSEFVKMVYKTLRKQHSKENHELKLKRRNIENLNDLILHLDKSDKNKKNNRTVFEKKGVIKDPLRRMSIPVNKRY